MSWLSRRWGSGPSVKGLVSSVKGTGHTIGQIADNPVTKAALAAALTATGVGAPAAAAILASEGALGGALKPGGGLKDAAVGGAEGAIAGGGSALAGKALSGLGSAVSSIPGVSGIEQGVSGAATGLNGLLQNVPGVTGAENLLSSAGGKIAGALTGGGSPTSLGSILGDAGQWLTGNGGKNALGLAQGINAAQLGAKENQYAQDAANTVNQSYNDRAPLRVAGLQGMLNAGRGNPFGGSPTGSPNQAAATPVRSLVAGGGL